MSDEEIQFFRDLYNAINDTELDNEDIFLSDENVLIDDVVNEEFSSDLQTPNLENQADSVLLSETMEQVVLALDDVNASLTDIKNTSVTVVFMLCLFALCYIVVSAFNNLTRGFN